MTWILVVEDDACIREVLGLILAEAGHTAVLSSNGRQALQILDARDPPRLILADLRMPQMSGQELIKAIRQRPALRHVPVVIQSAERAVVDDVQGYILKPFTPPELVAAIDRVLRPALFASASGPHAVEQLNV